LHTLGLKRCDVNADDFRSLLLSCPGLKSLYFHCGTEELSQSPTPAAVIELLEPLEATLEVLSLDFDMTRGHCEIWDTDKEDHRLDSLSHMTALRTLDTTAEMWKGVDPDELSSNGYDSELCGATLVESLRLCLRLPPSLSTFIFHHSEEETEPTLAQISDLIRTLPDILPNLAHLCITADDEYYMHQFNRLLVEKAAHLNAGPHPLKTSPGHSKLTSGLDAIVPSHLLPDTKWFGTKYASRFRKPDELHRAMETVSN
jgi:hypothetical protein